jgi:hypothetical protein
MYFNSIKAFSLLVWKRGGGGAKGSMWTHGLNASSIYKIYEYMWWWWSLRTLCHYEPRLLSKSDQNKFWLLLSIFKMDHQCKKKNWSLRILFYYYEPWFLYPNKTKLFFVLLLYFFSFKNQTRGGVGVVGTWEKRPVSKFIFT